MYKNYFFLNRFVCEVNEIISSKKVINTFSQEKDKLIISLDDDSGFIEISVNPGNPFILLRNEYFRAKKNSLDFFQKYFPAKITTVEIASNDRIIKITADKFTLYFIIRGKYSNVILFDNDNNIEAFKSIEDTFIINFKKELSGLIFSSYFHIPELSSIDKNNFTENVRKSFPVITKEIILEYKLQLGAQNDSPDLLEKIISSFEEEQIVVNYDQNNGEVNCVPYSFQLFKLKDKSIFDNYSDAVKFCISKKYSIEKSSYYKKLIGKTLERELHRISSKLNNLLSRIENGSKEEFYNKLGNLLLININSIYKGNSEIIVEDAFADNQMIKIPLKETIEPNKQPSFYFDKARSEKIAFNKSQELYKKAKNDFNRLKIIENRFLLTEDINDYREIMKELKLKKIMKVLHQKMN